ncbi:hypothetical protein L499_A0604 [Bordetella holmesii CDC-H635-BH]|nr:hypothetical protein L499_A0604 [Bordetella holmesii CDC-H635-BH]KCV04516.1 hypothetical protein L501_0594 [Bordetella holmesii CDC-H719-BH]
MTSPFNNFQTVRDSRKPDEWALDGINRPAAGQPPITLT